MMTQWGLVALMMPFNGLDVLASRVAEDGRTPMDEAGEYECACPLGMFRGKIVVE